ncbi:MAG: hypothetical protein ABIJ16_05650, partial [Bacteroidota bacterium]
MKYIALISLAVIFIFFSCSKPEGEGGSSSITGKILVKEYIIDDSNFHEEYYAPAEDVYIIYGEEDLYGDNIETHSDGTFRFEYLRKGKYTLYAYSEDPNTESGIVPVQKEVEITKAGEAVDAGEIILEKFIDFNDGSSSITGKVWVRDYNGDFTILNGQFYGEDEDVFLVYGNQSYYVDDVSTNYNGVYHFEDLPMGNYKVYAYSKDMYGTSQSGYIPVMKEVTISYNGQNVTLD